ncbi:MAG: hypothetical protein AAGA87_12740 [Pseudomonadota bacterium]
MIQFLVHRRNTRPLDRLLAVAERMGVRLKVTTYQDAFGRREIEAAPTIFTDFDLLHSYEIDAAAQAAAAIRTAGAPVVNDPSQVLRRGALLRRLHAKGLNTVEVTNLEFGETPMCYPVFLRSDAGCAGPETHLLSNETEYHAAVEALVPRGLTTAGRLALTFCSEKDADGFYRKYGAFVINGHVVPQHILRSRDWNVKSGAAETDPAFIAEERRFVDENPHADALLRIARAGHIDYGRVDYTIVEGDIVVFEINTNPKYPNFIDGDPARDERRATILAQLATAFRSIDGEGRGAVPFGLGTSGNTGFIESDRWYAHPLHALSRLSRWRQAAARIRRRRDKTKRKQADARLGS